MADAQDRPGIQKELGLRLAELRRRAGLKQTELAQRMGLVGRRNQPAISRLETGDFDRPSINFIADFLRACRAGFGDIQDILDKYTSLVPVAEVEAREAVAKVVEHLPQEARAAVAKYEAGTARTMSGRAGGEPERRVKVKRELTREERVGRVRRMLGRQYQKTVLEEKLLGVLKELGKALPVSERREACEHGRRVFSALVRSQGNEVRRAVRLNKARLRAEEEGIDPEVAEKMAQAATEAFNQLEKEGRIDWLPSNADIAALRLSPFKVMRAEVLADIGRVRAEDAYWKKREQFKVLIALTVNPKLEAMRLDSDTRSRQYMWAMRLLDSAIDRGLEAARAEAEQVIPKSRAPEITRFVTEETLKLFEERKAKLPMRPSSPD